VSTNGFEEVMEQGRRVPWRDVARRWRGIRTDRGYCGGLDIPSSISHYYISLVLQRRIQPVVVHDRGRQMLKVTLRATVDR